MLPLMDKSKIGYSTTNTTVSNWDSIPNSQGDNYSFAGTGALTISNFVRNTSDDIWFHVSSRTMWSEYQEPCLKFGPVKVNSPYPIAASVSPNSVTKLISYTITLAVTNYVSTTDVAKVSWSNSNTPTITGGGGTTALNGGMPITYTNINSGLQTAEISFSFTSPTLNKVYFHIWSRKTYNSIYQTNSSVSNPLTINSPYPTRVISTSITSIEKFINRAVKLTLAGVTTVSTSAYVYYSQNPLLKNPGDFSSVPKVLHNGSDIINFTGSSNNEINFTFTPGNGNSIIAGENLYFYVQSIGIDNVSDTNYLISGTIEITRPTWVPWKIDTTSITNGILSNVSTTHDAVVGISTNLTFYFLLNNPTVNFPSAPAKASDLFSLKINTVTDASGILDSATLGRSSPHSVTFPYTAANTNKITFEFITKYDISFIFIVDTPDIYEFPTLNSTVGLSRSITSIITSPTTVKITSKFSANIISTSIDIKVTPQGYSDITPTSIQTSNDIITYDIPIKYDVSHSGIIRLIYGGIYKDFNWSSGLDGSNIYSFPTSYTFSGDPANTDENGQPLAPGKYLKDNIQGNVILKMIGGDRLHSTNISDQIDYIKYKRTTDGGPITVTPGDISISGHDITVKKIKPLSVSDIEFYVKLKGPDTLPGQEITGTLLSGNIQSYIPPTSFTYTVTTLNPYYTTQDTEIEITATGHDKIDTKNIKISYSTDQNGSSPTPTLIGTTNFTGSAPSVNAILVCKFPPPGDFYLFIQIESGGVSTSYIKMSAPATISIINYPLPTSILSSTVTTPIKQKTKYTYSLKIHGRDPTKIVKTDFRSLYLENIATTNKYNLQIDNYTPGTATLDFTINPSATDVLPHLGMNKLVTVLKAPIAGSTEEVTLTYLDTSGQGYFVDQLISSYTMPRSFTFTPMHSYLGGAGDTVTLTLLGQSKSAGDNFPYTIYSSDSISDAKNTTGLTVRGSGTFSLGGNHKSTITTTHSPYNFGPHYYYIVAQTPSGNIGPIIYPFESLPTATWHYKLYTNIYDYSKSSIGDSSRNIVSIGRNGTAGTASFENNPDLFPLAYESGDLDSFGCFRFAGGTISGGVGSYNSVTNYLVLPNTSFTNKASFTLWFRSHGNNNIDDISIIDFGNNFRLSTAANPKNLYFNGVVINSTITVTTSAVISWIFIALNIDNKNVKWFIADTTGNTDSGNITISTTSLSNITGYLGHSTSVAKEFQGLMMNARFFAGINLTDNQIKLLSDTNWSLPTIPSIDFVIPSNSWIPTAIDSFTSTIPYKAVVNAPVTLTFYFKINVSVPPGKNVSDLFNKLYINNSNSIAEDTLLSNSAGTLNRQVGNNTCSLQIPFTATSYADQEIKFTNIYGMSYIFKILKSDVYEFPTLASASVSPSNITVGENITFSAKFDKAMPGSLTATTIVTPDTYSSISPAPTATVTGGSDTITIPFKVEYDVIYIVDIVLRYNGATSKTHTSRYLANNLIYTFPTNVTKYDGTQTNDARWIGGNMNIHLKENQDNKLTLTFNNDGIHTSTPGNQIDSIVWRQNESNETIIVNSCTCTVGGNASGQISFQFKPTTSRPITITIKLKGPDNVVSSSNIVVTIPTEKFDLGYVQELQAFSLGCTSSRNDFSGAFKTKYMPQCAMRAWDFSTSVSWNSLWNSGSSRVLDISDQQSSDFVTNYFGSTFVTPLGRGTTSNENALARYMWYFSTPKIIKSILIYGATPGWVSEWIKFEIVASNDGINFVRLPTIWENSTENTFHVKYDRKDATGKYTFRFGETLDEVATLSSPGNISSGKNNLNKSSTIPIYGFINIDNSEQYNYYGFGNVGSDTPYSSSSRVDILTRTYARSVYSYYIPATDHAWTYSSNNRIDAITDSNSTFRAKMPWLVNQGYGNFLLPQIDSVRAPAPTSYKYWRLRATTDFLGVCGNKTKVYFWKFGLYRNMNDATNDTYGLSSNNYLQQYSNSITINKGGSPTTATPGSSQHNSICVNKNDWTTSYNSTIMATNANVVTFTTEADSIIFTLDVSCPETSVIRFPDIMHYEAYGLGGTFILEASNDPALSVWTTLRAVASNGNYLGRQGIITPSSTSPNSDGTVTITNKLFTISNPSAITYNAPNNILTSANIANEELTSGTSTPGKTIAVSGGTGASNTKEDFSVHIILSTESVWSVGTKFNCIVTGYDSGTGIITFTATSDISGTCKCIVLIRSALGTGELKRTLVDTKTFTVKQGSYVLSKSTMSTGGGPPATWNNYSGSWGITPTNISSWGTFTEYYLDKSGEFILKPSGARITSPMFRITGSSPSPNNVIVNGIKYLMIIENEAVNSASTNITNAIKWTATDTTTSNSCSVSLYKGSFSTLNGTYTTNFTGAGAASVIKSVRVNGSAVTVGSPTIVGPLTLAEGLRAHTYAAPNGVTGGLSYTDYVMHIEFTNTVTLRLDGFNVLATQTDPSTYARSSTFAYLTRFGAFNAYVSSTYTDIDNFVSNADIQTIISNYGIPMQETANSLAPRLAQCYGMAFDMNSAITLIGSNSGNVADNTPVTLSSSLSATALNRVYPAMSTTSLPPIATISTNWPWSGYSYATQSSGYFFDPDSQCGLPLINNTGTPPNSIIIKESLTNKKYVLINVTGGRTWTVGLPSQASFSTNSTSFGGTLLDSSTLSNTNAQGIMTNGVNAIKYTAISWVGCAFFNQTSFTPPSNGQSFPWNGFYLGSGTAQSSPTLMNNTYINTSKVIVWDIAQASGSSFTPGSVFLKNNIVPSNVLMWTPLPGTKPSDRSLLHVFTLRINNTIGKITESNANDWVQLYQNGIELKRVNIISGTAGDSTLSTTSGGGTTIVNNILFSEYNALPAGSKSCGAPIAHASTTISTASTWAFAENNVAYKSTVHDYDSIVDIATNLCTKWGILPPLKNTPGDKQVISIVFASASGTAGAPNNMASDTKIHRIGFFFTFEDAKLGSDDLAEGSLGFSITDWTNTSSSVRDSLSKGCATIGTSPNTRVVSTADVGYSPCTSGPYIRILMTTSYATPVDIRMWLRLKISGNNYKWYSLAFSYSGQARNSVTDSIFDSTKSSIVYNGIYRLIELTGEPSGSPPTPNTSGNWGSLQTYSGQSDITIADIATQTQSNSGTLSQAILDKFYNNTSGLLSSLKIYGGNTYTNPITATPTINVSKNIPAWTPTSGTIDANNEYVPCFELGKVSGTPATSSAQPYYAQLGFQSTATSGQENQYLSRVLMDYGSGVTKCINKLLILSPTPGYNVVWSKFEIVASIDGINFIRLPTKWYVGSDVTETTFSLYWKRARSGNTPYSIVPSLNGQGVENVVTNGTVYPANSYFPWSTSATSTVNAPLFMWTIDIDNNSAYRYYGFGNVGSDIYFNGASNTLSTTYTRSPSGYSGFSSVGSIYTWNSYDASGWSTGSNPTLNTTNITNISNVDKIRIFLPQVSPTIPVAAPTYYKYWRIRPTTSFLATIGTTFNLYLWKLGLYRTVTEAVNDQYGFSSNNYLQQYGNTMYINDSNVNQANASAMFVHTGVWTDNTVAVINATAYNNLRLPISNSSNNTYFKLDVYGEIKAIRFPDFMNFDANVRGGTFILERGNHLSITSLTSSGTVATATTASAHSYKVGDYVSITGATPTGYNLSVAINTIPATNTFTYTIAGTLAAASGTITSILWEPMVVTKNNSTDILARNGIMSESANTVGTAAVPLSTSSSVYRIETVSEAATRLSLSGYSVPTGANSPNVTVQPLLYNTSKEVTIQLTGGNNINYNTKEDFSIHFSISSTPLDLSSGLTKFNCIVTNYSSPTITFNTTPDFTGDGYFHIFIRNGLGTGITTNTASIVSSMVNVPPYAYILDDRVITSSGPWTGMGSPPAQHLSWPISSITSNYTEYKPDKLGEYSLVSSSPITNKMFRSTGTSAFSGTINSVTGIKYLMIIENESCLFSTAAISNSIKWTATSTSLSGKSVQVTSNKGTFSTSVLDTTTGKYKTGFTFTGGSTASEWFNNVYVNGCSVTADNTTLTSIGPLTAAKGLRFTNIGAGTVDAALGGLCGTDYVMHIEFRYPVTIQIDGFNVFATDTGTYLGRGTSGTHTFANYPRFGAFNAYSYGFDSGSGAITSISSFITQTSTICSNLGIPMLETNTNLGPILTRAYGMPIDVNASFNYYTGLTSPDGTSITFSQTYPTTILRSARSRTYSESGLTPIDLYSSNWPWAGYASNNGSASNQLPSGYFVDPISGLFAIGNNGTLPGTIIKVSPANKKYVYINAASNSWVIGGIKGVGNPATPFGASPAFRGTILDTTPADLMTRSIQSKNYTAISWVGCAFHNQTCLAPITNAKQSFVWSGFYLGSGTAQSSVTLMNSSNINTSKVIVWDIALANGETPSYSSATYITNNAGPHNVLTWTPLVGTNPDDRNTLHVFTLLINDDVTIASNGSNIDDWVQLYQNGIKLTRANTTIATNLRTTYSASVGLKFMYNSLFTQVTNSSDLSALFNGASTAGGTPAVNAYAVSTGTQWSFAENDVRIKNTSYVSSDVFTIMSDLGTKWGIVPPLYASSSGTDLFVINIGGAWTGTFNLSRVGFFSNIDNAVDGSNNLDLARDIISSSNNLLGFDNSIAWGSTSSSSPINSTTRGTWNISTPSTLNIQNNWNFVEKSGIPCGAFIRLSMLFTGSRTEADKLRIRLILTHNGVSTLYGLGFSHNGTVYNTADQAFLSATDGSILAYKSIFRLVRSKSSNWADHDLAQSDKWEWSNPYTIVMDSMSPAITLGAAKSFAIDNNSSLSNFTNAFKNAYLPANNTCDMKRFYYSSCGANIPSWEGMWNSISPSLTPTVTTTYNNIYSSIDTFTLDSRNCPLGNDSGTNVSDSLVRYMWYFPTAVNINKLMFYSGTPGWQSEWIKFEIVASIDGINFVRLPTEWSSKVEETFDIKYNKKSKGNYDTFTFADTLTAANSSSNTNITEGKFLLTTTNTRAISWYVSFINDKKYNYYGFGNVGTDTPYYNLVSASSDVTTRTYSRRPFSSSISGTLHQTTSLASNTVGYAVTNNTNLMANTGNLPWLVPSSGTAQGYATAIIPIVSVGGTAYGTFTKYKYWRLRPTSAFLGSTGTAKVYFWKLGLYRNSADATADIYGLSSNNYFQQYANTVSFYNGSVYTAVNNATAQHRAICVNLGTWDQTSAQTIAAIGGTTALGTNANVISFTAESHAFCIKLDVTMDIEKDNALYNSNSANNPVIRFPSYMRFDASMGGS